MTQPSTCRVVRAPTIAAVTPGCASTQATPSVGSPTPSPSATILKRSTNARLRETAGSWNAGELRRQSPSSSSCKPLHVDSAGEDARGEGRVAQDSGAVRRRPGQHGPADATGQHRQCRLHGVDVANGLAALEQFDVEIRHADPSDLALVHERGHRRPRVFDRRSRGSVGPVNLIEVDALHAEAAEARLALFANRLRSQVVSDLAVRSALPSPSALREHEHVFTGAIGSECPSDDLFGVAEPVHGCRVDPVHAELHGVPNRSDRTRRRPPRPSRIATARRRPSCRSRRSSARARSHRDVVFSRAGPSVSSR